MMTHQEIIQQILMLPGVVGIGAIVGDHITVWVVSLEHLRHLPQLVDYVYLDGCLSPA